MFAHKKHRCTSTLLIYLRVLNPEHESHHRASFRQVMCEATWKSPSSVIPSFCNRLFRLDIRKMTTYMSMAATVTQIRLQTCQRRCTKWPAPFATILWPTKQVRSVMTQERIEFLINKNAYQHFETFDQHERSKKRICLCLCRGNMLLRVWQVLHSERCCPWRRITECAFACAKFYRKSCLFHHFNIE